MPRMVPNSVSPSPNECALRSQVALPFRKAVAHLQQITWHNGTARQRRCSNGTTWHFMTSTCVASAISLRFYCTRRASARARRGLHPLHARATGEVDEDRDPDPNRRNLSMILTGLTAAVGLSVTWKAATKLLDFAGTNSFQSGKLENSISWFDASAQIGVPRWLLWKRGIALYYLGRYAEAAAQFRENLTEKPKVMEESVWLALCEARQGRFDEARKQMRVFDKEHDVFVTIYPGVSRSIFTLWCGGDGEMTARLVLEESAKAQGFEGFYAALYLGLFFEAKGDTASARRWITFASNTDFAQRKGSSDFMVGVAQLHAQLRGWN
eukprot:TRINITY_DN13756_c0_g1_i1.p1 TRINITY_DN13756_c0_g1~~TRINITY_DN13756_c0_g1_i1.p1  ORF type:complete len:325 (-),score=53.32 TRINITY_DN13756_c0_g1_i1:81-1055(-)